MASQVFGVIVALPPDTDTSSLSPVAATHTGSPARNAETTIPNTGAFGLGFVPLAGRDLQSGVVPECPHPAPEWETGIHISAITRMRRRVAMAHAEVEA